MNRFDDPRRDKFPKESEDNDKEGTPDLKDALDSLLGNFLGKSGATEKSIESMKNLLQELGQDPELKDVLTTSPKGGDFSKIYQSAKKLTSKISEYSKREEFKEAMSTLDKEKIPNLQDVLDSQKSMFSDYFGKVMDAAPRKGNAPDPAVQQEIVQGVNSLFDEMASKLQNQSESLKDYRDNLLGEGEKGLDPNDPNFEEKMASLMEKIEGDEGYKDLRTKMESFLQDMYEKMVSDPKVRGQMHLYGKVDRISRITDKIGLVPTTKEKKRQKEKSINKADDMFFHQNRV